jgi:hypothetical protein
VLFLLSVTYAERHYAECRYAEGRGAVHCRGGWNRTPGLGMMRQLSYHCATSAGQVEHSYSTCISMTGVITLLFFFTTQHKSIENSLAYLSTVSHMNKIINTIVSRRHYHEKFLCQWHSEKIS